MNYFVERPSRDTELPTVQTFEQAQEAAEAFFAHASQFADMCQPEVADLLAPLLLCWPAATPAKLTFGDVIRLLDLANNADAMRAQFLAATPAGPARDALAKVEGFDRGALLLALQTILKA